MKGDGSVYQTTDEAGRVRWVAAVSVPGRTSQVRRRLPPGADERAAKKLLRDLRNMRARGELDAPVSPEPAAAPLPLPTFAEAAEVWVEAGFPGGRASKSASPRTYRSYADFVRLRIVPSELGALRLGEVRRRDVAAFLAELAESGLTRSTLQKMKGVVGRVYRYAQLLHEDELGERGNPADVEVPRPARGPKVRRALSASEVAKLLCALEDSVQLDAWMRLAFDTGLRPGEEAALEWSDLDLGSDPATVTVTKALTWDPVDGSVFPRLNDTKTGESGHRRLTLSASTVRVLRAYRKWLAAQELATPGYWPDEQHGIVLGGRVFRRADGLLVDNQWVARRVGPVAEACGVGKVTPYEARHTAATLMDELLPVGIAARALGHSQEHASRVTAGYIHRRIATVESAVLDLALEGLSSGAVAQ